MFKQTKNIISVVYSLIKFLFIKLLRIREFNFYIVERFSPNTMINIWKGGHLKLGERVRAHSGVKISVTPGGTMKIGNDVRINYDCIFVCRERIEIADGVEFGPRVMIYDHDHDYSTRNGIKDNQFKSAPISIGENTWIGASCIILRGSTIGKNCVIGAGCIVRGNVPEGTVLVQKRQQEMRMITC